MEKMLLPITPSWTNVWASLHSFLLGIASLSSCISLFPHASLPPNALPRPHLCIIRLSLHLSPRAFPQSLFPSVPVWLPLPLFTSLPSISLSIPPYVHPYLSIHSSLHQSLPPFISLFPTPHLCSSLLLSMRLCLPLSLYHFSLHSHPFLYISSFPMSVIPTSLPAIRPFSHQPIASSHRWVATTVKSSLSWVFSPFSSLFSYRHLRLWTTWCSPTIRNLKPSFSISQNVTLFGRKTFKEVIKVKCCH